MVRADVPPVRLPVSIARVLDTCKQGALDLYRYLHIGIGLAAVHRCPQLLASLENSSAELKNLPTGLANII